jgi:hypothetical protein
MSRNHEKPKTGEPGPSLSKVFRVNLILYRCSRLWIDRAYLEWLLPIAGYIPPEPGPTSIKGFQLNPNLYKDANLSRGMAIWRPPS